jgi:hypothetical protein
MVPSIGSGEREMSVVLRVGVSRLLLSVNPEFLTVCGDGDSAVD